MTNRFLRVGKSDFLASLKNGDATVRAIKQKKYVYIDFDDQKHIKVLEESQPNDSDEETEIIGNSHIGNISKLSPKTFQMLRYLSETKNLQDKRSSIERMIRTRVKRHSQNSTHNSVSFQEKALFNNKITSQKLEEYLQNAKNQRVVTRLEEGQKELERSISAASAYKKLMPLQVQNRPPGRGNRLPPLLRLRNALNA